MLTRVTLLHGDCRDVLRTLPADLVHCVVTSPPYFGLRQYAGVEATVWADGWCGCLGNEPTPDLYVAHLVEVFREVRRVLRDDGTAWLVLGDSYASTSTYNAPRTSAGEYGRVEAPRQPNAGVPAGLKPKDLVGIPWRVAFALQADGWYLRSDIIWSKPNPMPESVTDRPTKAHEYVFLLAKSERYYYDAEAVADPATNAGKTVTLGPKSLSSGLAAGAGVAPSGNGTAATVTVAATRNRRSVWTIPTAPYPEAHFATFPPDLVKPCVLAGTSARGCCATCGAPWGRVVERTTVNCGNAARAGTRIVGKGHVTDQVREDHDIRNGPTAVTQTTGWRPSCDHADAPVVPCTVLDPFVGSGTTCLVAQQLGRDSIGIDASAEYLAMARARTAQSTFVTS